MKQKIQKAIDALQAIKDAKPSTLNLGRLESYDRALANLESMLVDTPEPDVVEKKPEAKPSAPEQLKTKPKASTAEDRLTKQ